MISQSEISLYVDAMIIESVARDPALLKRAAIGDTIMSLINKVKSYFGSKINPANKTESILNLLAPFGISALFSALSMPWIGVLLSLATQIFKINVGGALLDIYNKIKPIITGGQQTTSAEVDTAVAESLRANYRPVTSADEEAALAKLRQHDQSRADDTNTTITVANQLHDARVVKLAMISFNNGELKKDAGWIGGSSFGELQTKILRILKKLFGFIFKVGLASAGVIVAGDVINSFLGRTDSGTGGFGAPSDTRQPTSTSVYVAKQTKFPVNPSYSGRKYNETDDDNWAEGFINNAAGISAMLVQFAKEVYGKLNGLESLMQSLPTFQETANTIERFNRSAAGSSVVFLPRYFHSKKQVVDLFIDDLAEKAP
jgi:hypothetical protein